MCIPKQFLPLLRNFSYCSFGFILFLIFQPVGLSAQGFLKADGQKIVNGAGEDFLLQGMGLGGWMLQEGYMLQTAEFANAQYKIRQSIEDLIGKERTDEFYEAWLANHVTEADIEALKSWGFNSVRLPMHYNLFTLPIQDEAVEGDQTWLDKGFELTDQLLKWCEKNEMYLILDLHATPGGQGYDQGISDYNPELPSLWESELNKAKTVALWKRLAERYKDKEWIGGYDLINEPNWDLPNNNQALRSIYERITAAIREVDNNHIIFIEGNWFANDFNGLTPPWDDNLVYSPHKYWSFNDQASIQWVLDLRAQHNVPLYLGESGENSNVWFRDAIELLEENNIGWAWWPMKKVESIAGPLSVDKTAGYEGLLNYWKGNTSRPDEDQAYEILMDLTERLKFENCRFQKDVVDAMFRQRESNSSIQFAANKIPGLIYATDFDLGTNGVAYQDTEDANYQVTTGNFTSWNNGWQYRNDGVGIQFCEDVQNSNGFNVAWTADGEWLKYTAEVITAGVYDVHIRVAAANAGSLIQFEVDEAVVSEPFPVPATGGFQSWETMIIPGISLSAGEQEIVCRVVKEGCNLSSFDFKYKSALNAVPFRINKAMTLDRNTIQVQLNKELSFDSNVQAEYFSLSANGEAIEIKRASLAANSNRVVLIETVDALRSDQLLRLNYAGSMKAIDETFLAAAENIPVENNLEPVHIIPGVIQAEDFFNAEGIELEDCTDVGQGQNVAYLDPGDFLEYEVTVDISGPYRVDYRVASQNTAGQIRLSYIDADGQVTVVDEPSFPITGAWQVWRTVENTIDLSEGNYTMRIDILSAPFNLNWIAFESMVVNEPPILGVSVYPNPVFTDLNIKAVFSIPHQVSYYLFDTRGQLIRTGTYDYTDFLTDDLDLSDLSVGMYFLELSLEDDTKYNFKIVKAE